MPFTFAHPAIILPFRKSNRFSFTALVAGSIVPDFEFFFQMREVENIGHRWYGIFLFDLPIALLFCFLFHNLLGKAMVANLPGYFRRRFAQGLNFSWNVYALNNKLSLVLSLITGIVSHILLDGFTHYDGFFVKMFPVLASKSSTIFLNLPVYFLLQLAFSVIGLVAVMMTIHSLPESGSINIPAEKTKWYWPSFLLIISVILFVRLAGWPQHNSFWGVFMAMMGASFYTWLLVSLFFSNYQLKNTQK